MVVLILAVSLGGGGDDDPSPIAADPNSSADPTDKDKPAEKSEPEPAAKWKTVNKLSGNTNRAGPDFHLNGCETRMTYNVQGSDSTIVAFYVMDSGSSFEEDGDIPLASPTETGPGETTIRKGEGDYYVNVIAANADWQVQVQEKC